MEFFQTNLPIQSVEQICRDNTHLKVLEICHATLLDEESLSMTPRDKEQDYSSAGIALAMLTIRWTKFSNSAVANKFSNFMAQVTYPALKLGKITFRDIHDVDDDEETKIDRMRVVSALIQPSVQQLTLLYGCPIEVMDVIEACASVTKIQLDDYNPPVDFRPAEVQEKLQAIAMRNRQLARFVANPRAYPVEELLVLMTQFDKSPIGRYMLARCLPGIPSFFKSKSTHSSTVEAKKRAKKRKHIFCKCW